MERRVRLNGAVFLNKYKDIILGKAQCPESSLPTPCLRPSNIGAADVKGAELEARVFATDGLSFDGSISFLDFGYTSATTGGFLANTGIPSGAITPYTPKVAYAVGAQYDLPISSGKISYRLDGAYQGEVFTTAENTKWSRVDSRLLWNGRVTWASEKNWKVAAEVQNLLDKYYFQSVSDVTTAFGGVTGVPGKPRTFAVSVERKF
jgi:iron complex outermembrane receptor protein